MFPKLKINRKYWKILVVFFVVFLLFAGTKSTFAAGETTNNSSFITTAMGYILPALSAINPGLGAAASIASAVTGDVVRNIIVYVLYTALQILAFFLGIVGFFFNAVFEITVLNMASVIQKIQIIQVGWQTVRDVTNIIFIFMLLYLAIATILQLDEHGVKHGLSRLIIGATLINFSLFFVKVPIDVSNIVAIQIYNTINPKAGDSEVFTGGGGRIGLGDMIMSMFNPQLVFKDPTLKNINSTSSKAPAASALGNNPLTTFAMGVIIISTATFIFLAVCVIFIKRFITLIMLMIFSPLAFAGMAIPSHDIEHEISHRFWNTLIKEAFYAPVFMFMMYLTIRTGQALNSSTVLTADIVSLDWAFNLPVTNIISYSVVIGMMIFSLTVSESMGVQGAGGAIKMFNGVRGATIGWLGANTVGRAAHTWVNKMDGSEFTKAAAGIGNTGGSRTAKLANFMATNKVARALGSKSVAKAISGTAQGLGKSSFGGDKSYDDKIHTREEEMEAALEEAHNDPRVLAKLLSQGVNDGFGRAGTSLKAVHRKFHHMSTEEKANTLLHMNDMIEKMTKGLKPGEKTGSYLDSHGHEQKFTSQDLDNMVKTKHALYEKDGHGRLDGKEVADFQRKISGGVDFHADKFKELLGDDHHAPDAAGMKVFIQNATEGQMKVALKSLGDAGRKFDITDDMLPKATDKPEVVREKETKIQQVQELRNVISDNISKFKGESFHASIAKDDGVALGIKDATAEGVYKAKMRFSMYSAFKGSDKNVDKVKALDNKELKEKFLSDVKVLPNMEDAIKEYDETKKLNPNDERKAFEKVVDTYGQRNAGEETTMKYADGANADRSAIKTSYIKAELDKHKELLEKVKVATSNTDATNQTPPAQNQVPSNPLNSGGTRQNQTTS